MNGELTIVYFVEGSAGVPRARHVDPLTQLWTLVADRFGLPLPSRIVPISKAHLVGMQAETRALARSSAIEPLDALMARALDEAPFDCAVVIWDLEPPWGTDPNACRWNETLLLYQGLAQSDLLPGEWRQNAARRYAELARRRVPAARNRAVRLGRQMVLPLCMEPVFEELLVQDEGLVRRALGVRGVKVREWPRWDVATCRRPDIEILQASIEAARDANPRLPIFRAIRGDMWTAKHEWGAYLLQRMLEDEIIAAALDGHYLVLRLREMLT